MDFRRARPLAVALTVAALAFAAHRALAPLAETDLFFHLKLGEIILARHRIPFRNLFSFTYPDHPDPDLAWGFQVLVALLHRAGGFSAIVVGKAVLFVAALALVIRSARRGGASALGAAAAATLAVLACEQRLVERPHLVTFVGLGALGLGLVEAERGRDRLHLAPLGTLVWANFHAGVFLAPGVLGLYGAGLAIDRALARRGGHTVAGPSLARLAILGALCAAATFATPAGTRLPSYLIWHTGLDSTRVIEEFRRADPWDDPWLFVLGGACGLAVLVAPEARRARRLLPLLAVGWLAVRSVRFAAEWSLLAAPLAADGFSRLERALGSRRIRAALAAAGLAALAAVTVAERRARGFAIGLDPDVVPFAAIDFVTRSGLRERLYHDLDVGCYLAWEGWPRFRVFQDARLPAYPDDFHRALDEPSPAAFDALLRRFSVDAALIAEPAINMRAGAFDPEEWALVYRARDALVFARRIEAHRDLIERLEIPLRVRFDFDHGSTVEPIARPPARSPVPRCAWQRRLAAALEGEGDPDRALSARARALDDRCLAPDEEAEVRYHLGARLQRDGRLAEAAAQYDLALARRPDDARALANRGFARLTSDRAAAEADLRRALALDPTRDDVRRALAR